MTCRALISIAAADERSPANRVVVRPMLEELSTGG